MEPRQELLIHLTRRLGNHYAEPTQQAPLPQMVFEWLLLQFVINHFLRLTILNLTSYVTHLGDEHLKKMRGRHDDTWRAQVLRPDLSFSSTAAHNSKAHSFLNQTTAQLCKKLP